MPTPKTVAEYLDRHPEYREALELLRKLILEFELEETIKWGSPVYTFAGKNILGLGAFKSYVGIWFFQGSFLSDPHQLLINAQEGKTRALRQMRFQSGHEIQPGIIRTYISEAIRNQQSGKEIKPEKPGKLTMPPILKEALQQDPKAKAGFGKLTPGRQREYAEYIREAKQETTKKRRIRKILPMITAGLGLNDSYK